MISLHNVCKSFGRKTVLDHVSLTIQKGEIAGFLGPNGAGKTTLMRILTGYWPSDSGRVMIDGVDVRDRPLEAKQRIGYLPETPPLYPDMTVRGYLSFCAGLKGLAKRQAAGRIDTVIRQCHLNDVLDAPIGTLSKGFKQRAGIAQAILHEPRVLILDEPTTGLDPRQIRQVRGLIRELSGQTTVVLCTHILQEIEQLAQRIIIIHQGRIAADGTSDTLKPDEGEAARSLEDVFLALTATPRTETLEP